MLPRLVAFCRGDVRAAAVIALGCRGIEAYDLVERLPRGPARLAAWNAYVLQTYADKLAGARRYVRGETAQLARGLYELAAAWVEEANRLLSDPEAPAAPPSAPLPHWHTPVRSQDQLDGMRETLFALRAFVAFDLESVTASDALEAQLGAIDASLESIERLWIARPPAEIRGGIGGALTDGLDRAYALGQQLATA